MMYDTDDYAWDTLMAFSREQAFRDNLSDDDEAPELVAKCNWCEENIYEDETYFHDTGTLYLCLCCIKEGLNNPPNVRFRGNTRARTR